MNRTDAIFSDSSNRSHLRWLAASYVIDVDIVRIKGLADTVNAPLRIWNFDLQDVIQDMKTKHTPNANITLQIQWVPFDFAF